MADAKIPPLINPTVDVAQQLQWVIGDTGTVMDSMGAFRIKVFHARMFPWDELPGGVEGAPGAGPGEDAG